MVGDRLCIKTLECFNLLYTEFYFQIFTLLSVNHTNVRMKSVLIFLRT